MVGSPLDGWVGLEVVVVITEQKITHGKLLQNHKDGLLVQLSDGRQEFIPQFLRVELRQQ